MRTLVHAVLLALIPSAAFADAPTDEAAIAASDQNMAAPLIAAGDRWRVLYEASEWDELLTLYTPDAVLMTQGSPKIEGRGAIVAFLRRLSDGGGSAAMQFDAEEAIIDGEYGFVTAKYRMDITMAGSEPVILAGRSLLIYKWQDEAWKLWRDIDNFAPDVTPADFEEGSP